MKSTPLSNDTILRVAEKTSPEVVWMELRDALAERDRLREALEAILVLGSPLESQTNALYHACVQLARQALRDHARPERVTHGRHCSCSACAREDWTNPRLASCGMHGPSCPNVYAPIGSP